MPPNAPFKISQDYEVAQPNQERAYPVPESDWEHLYDKVSRISSPGLTLHTLGSVLLGCSASALIAALSLPTVPADPSDKGHFVCWVISLAALICGGAFLYLARVQRASVMTSAHDVLEDMRRLERRYKAKTQSRSSLHEYLTTHRFALIFKPPRDAKDITFDPSGIIGVGQNMNESSWEVVDEQLVIRNEKRQDFSRFLFDRSSGRLISCNGDDTVCKRQQYIEPA